VLRNFWDLVALTCGASHGGTEQGEDPLHSVRLAAVKRYVDRRLADPSLTPAAAAAFGIAARQLHRLIEAKDCSFARCLSRQRLLRVAARSPQLRALWRRLHHEVDRYSAFSFRSESGSQLEHLEFAI
jgi:hypothetical protein